MVRLPAARMRSGRTRSGDPLGVGRDGARHGLIRHPAPVVRQDARQQGPASHDHVRTATVASDDETGMAGGGVTSDRRRTRIQATSTGTDTTVPVGIGHCPCSSARSRSVSRVGTNACARRPRHTTGTSAPAGSTRRHSYPYCGKWGPVAAWSASLRPGDRLVCLDDACERNGDDPLFVFGEVPGEVAFDTPSVHRCGGAQHQISTPKGTVGTAARSTTRSIGTSSAASTAGSNCARSWPFRATRPSARGAPTSAS